MESSESCANRTGRGRRGEVCSWYVRYRDRSAAPSRNAPGIRGASRRSPPRGAFPSHVATEGFAPRFTETDKATEVHRDPSPPPTVLGEHPCETFGRPMPGDSAYRGYDKEHANIDYPHKKPKGGEPNREEKEYNAGLSRFRVKVEHRIGSAIHGTRIVRRHPRSPRRSP